MGKLTKGTKLAQKIFKIESAHRFIKITKAAKILNVTAPALYNYSVEKQCYIKDENDNFQIVDGLKLNVVDIELIND